MHSRAIEEHNEKLRGAEEIRSESERFEVCLQCLLYLLYLLLYLLYLLYLLLTTHYLLLTILTTYCTGGIRETRLLH